jgi:hypothetical protein
MLSAEISMGVPQAHSSSGYVKGACMLTSSISSVAQSEAYCLFRCISRLLLARVRSSHGVAVKGLLPTGVVLKSPTQTCASDSTSLGPFHSGSLPWWASRKGSVRSADKCHCRGQATCLIMPSLPVATTAVQRAIQRTRVTSATGDDGIGPAFNKHAVLGGTAHTPDRVLAPLLGRLFRAVLCSGHVLAAWKEARLTPLFQ